LSQTVASRIFRGPFQRALVLEKPDPGLDHALREMGIEVERIDRALEEDELVDRLATGRHQLIFKRSRTPITRPVIEASPELYAVFLCCIGDDSVDKEAAADHGVLVMNDPISNGRSVAELVVGEMICLARRVFDAAHETAGHRFSKSHRGRYELMGKTLGVYGLGNIGRQVAQLGTGLGMTVCFFDNREVAVEVGTAMGWRACTSLTQLFELSHVVSVHVSARDWRGGSNRGVLRFEHFQAMDVPGKQGPRIFINAARGFIHTADELIAAVRKGHLDSAFVDVFEEEPRSANDDWQNPYADIDHLYTTPHIGAATVEAQPRIAAHIANTTRLLNDTGRVRDCVFRPGREIGTDPKAGATVLSVVHTDERGTKKAVDDVIYDSGASNLQSAHRDFPSYGIAYELAVIDRPLTDAQLESLVQTAAKLTGNARAIRSVRQFTVPQSHR
jgi:D-3-phosphoglycerate dehydrogenase / 2-oxoglutarate reductase